MQRLISATFVLESTPPLRKAPNGTSLTMCERTASSTSSRVRATKVASSCSAAVGTTASQYCAIRGAPRPS
jgi:hypothetical protein